LHLYATIAACAAAVVVVAWLAVSFMSPGTQRRKIEWVGATGLFVALLALFVNLLRRAIATDSEAGMIAFGFLTFMFSCSLLVSMVRTVGALRGRTSSSKSSATH